MEKWKDIKGYEGHYQVSDLGRVKSVKKGAYKLLSERFGGRYHKATLCKNGGIKDKYVHILVAEAFLGYKKGSSSVVVDHINGNRLDNRPENLQIITQRENINRGFKKDPSLYGIRNAYKDKWYAQIRVGSEIFHLGSFDTKERASIAYQFALTQLDEFKQLIVR